MFGKIWKKIRNDIEDLWWKEGFWEKLQKNHPLVYEATQWMILAISVLAIIINVIKIT